MTDTDILVELESASLVRLVVFDQYGAESLTLELRGRGIKEMADIFERQAESLSSDRQQQPRRRA